MVDTPSKAPTQSSINQRAQYDANARLCLLAYKAEKIPPAEVRANVGPRWEEPVGLAERAKPGIVGKLLDSMVKSEKYDGLRELLNEKEQQPAPSGSAALPHSEGEMPPLPESARQPVGLLASVSAWLTAYIAYSRQLSPEGYKDFHLACALWVLSTVAARRIQVPLADPVITPLSLMMVARTSLFAKSTTAKGGIRLLRAANLGCHLGDDETTPQRLLYDMAGHVPTNYGSLSPEEKLEIDARLAFSAQIGSYNDEVNQLLNAMTRPGPMADFAGLLRKLDNCPEDYRYSTKSGGQDKIKYPYLAFLASTTPANLAKHAGRNAEFWNDGFWARMLFICPPPHDFVTQTMTEGMVTPPRSLVDPLIEWNKRLIVPHCEVIEEIEKDKPTGRYTATVDPLTITTLKLEKGVIAAFDSYRVALRQLVAENKGTQDLDGSYSRLPTQALRIAALIASLEHQDRINIEVWALAQEIAELFRKNLHELYAQINASVEENPVEDLLITHLKGLEQGEMTTVREIRLNAHPTIRKMKPDTVRDLLLGLEKSGIVTCSKEGKKECYSITA